MIRFTEYPAGAVSAKDAILHYKNFDYLKKDNLFLWHVSLCLHVLGVRDDLYQRMRLFR